MKELNVLAGVLADEIDEIVSSLNKLDIKDNQIEYVHKLGELSAYNKVFRAVMVTLEGDR